MRLFMTTCFLISFSLGAYAQNNQQGRDRASINALIKGINVLAQSDLSCMTSNDCALFSVGSRACGGPSSYVLTSVYNSNFEEIDALAEKSREKEYAFNVQYRIHSACSLLDSPRTSCVKKICTFQ